MGTAQIIDFRTRKRIEDLPEPDVSSTIISHKDLAALNFINWYHAPEIMMESTGDDNPLMSSGLVGVLDYVGEVEEALGVDVLEYYSRFYALSRPNPLQDYGFEFEVRGTLPFIGDLLARAELDKRAQSDMISECIAFYADAFQRYLHGTSCDITFRTPLEVLRDPNVPERYKEPLLLMRKGDLLTFETPKSFNHLGIRIHTQGLTVLQTNFPEEYEQYEGHTFPF